MCFYLLSFQSHPLSSPPSWVGEDVFFLQLWASLGGKVWADVHRGLDHQGTHVWDGRHFPNSLQVGMGGVCLYECEGVMHDNYKYK